VERSITIYGLNDAFEAQDMDIRSFLSFAGEAGIDAVDVGYYWQDESSELGLLPQWAKENGLKLGAYICRNDFNSPEPEEIERQVEIIKHAIDNAVALKIKYVRIFIAWFIFEKTYWDIKDWLIPALKRVTDYAKKKGVILAIENHGYIGGASDELLDILHEVDSSHLRILLDIGNFLAVGEDPLDGARALIPYTVHVHIKDFRICSLDETSEGLISTDGRKIVPAVVGEGDLDIEGSIRLLQQAGYDGYLSIECEAPGDPRKNTLTSLRFVDDILKRLSAG